MLGTNRPSFSGYATEGLKAEFPRGWEQRMRIERKFTEAGKSPYDAIPFREGTSEIRNPDGSVVFSLERFQVPAHWSQVAADILAQKYFRKAGVPAKAKRVEESTLPSWLWRSVPDEGALAALPEAE